MAGNSRSIEHLQSEAEGRVRQVLRGLGPLGLLGPLASGNVSSLVEVETGLPPLVITQKGFKLDHRLPLAMAHWSLDPIQGVPSTELLMHKTIYTHREGVRAVAHLHSPFATAVSCWKLQSLPYFHYHQSLLGGATPVIPFAVPGSTELSALITLTLSLRTSRSISALILQNHGALVWAPTPDLVLKRAQVLEDACRLMTLAPNPNWLQHIAESYHEDIEEMFANYAA